MIFPVHNALGASVMQFCIAAKADPEQKARERLTTPPCATTLSLRKLTLPAAAFWAGQ